MKHMFKFAAMLLVVLGLSVAPVYAQTTINTTTLATAVTSVSATSVAVASASTIAVGQQLYIDKEVMVVTAINGTQLTVTRGMAGTASAKHASGRVVYSGPANYFVQTSPSGACVLADQVYYPVINTTTGQFFNCSASGTGAASTYVWKGVAFDSFEYVGWPRTPVSNANYQMKSTDVVVSLTSLSNSGKTVWLPTLTGQPARMLIIRDESGAANSFTITVSGTINGSTSNTITTAYGALRIWWSGTAFFLW